jgi:hypothetical protein
MEEGNAVEGARVRFPVGAFQLALVGIAVATVVYMLSLWPSIQDCSVIRSELMAGNYTQALQHYGRNAGWDDADFQRFLGGINISPQT